MRTFIFCLLLALAATVAGCSTVFDPLPIDDAVTQQKISTWVPEKTSLEDAAHIMRTHGFHYRYHPESPTEEGRLVCWRDGLGIFTYRVWNADFKVQDGRVYDLKVYMSYTAL
jgi:hypothetical protein